MLCAGATALVDWWDKGGTFEHVSSFILVSVILMEIYLVSEADHGVRTELV